MKMNSTSARGFPFDEPGKTGNFTTTVPQYKSAFAVGSCFIAKIPLRFLFRMLYKHDFRNADNVFILGTRVNGIDQDPHGRNIRFVIQIQTQGAVLLPRQPADSMFYSSKTFPGTEIRRRASSRKKAGTASSDP